MNTKKNTHTSNYVKKKFSLFFISIIQLLVSILGCASLASWIAYKWTSNTFGDALDFDQILWTISYSQTGAPLDLVLSAILYSFFWLVLCFIWVVLVFGINHIDLIYRFLLTVNKFILKIKTLCLKIYTHLQKATKMRFYNIVFISTSLIVFCSIAVLSFTNALKTIDKRYKFTDYLKIQKQLDKYDYINEYYDVPQLSEISFKDKKNIILVLGESLESNFRSNDPLSTELDRLSKQGASVYNMVNTAGSGWTIAAMTGWHFGLPLKLPNKLLNDYHSPRGFLPNALSIFDILKKNGYKTVLLIGSDSHFSGQKKLFESHGEFEILDKKYWIKKGYDLKKYQGTDWGFSDGFVFERAKEEFIKLQNEGKPFVLFVETVDTHAPDGWCPEDKKVYYDIRDAYLETDRQIGSFTDFIFENKKSKLVIGIIGDHLFMGEPSIFQGIDRRIRNIFLGDIPTLPKEKVNSKICAVDMAPTILEACGAVWNSSRFGLGTSIFSKERALIDKIGEKTYNEFVSYPSKRYQSFY